MAVNKLDITMMEDVGTSANQLLQRDGSGNMPAVNASQVSGLSEFTTSTSDPVITTNPSGGVGSLWYNKTSGEMYVCTDATAGANVWTNVGEGTGDVQLKYRGDNYGFAQGAGITPASNVIDKWPFASDSNATDHGDLVVYGTSRGAASGSDTHGYHLGGASNGTGNVNNIQKYQFSTAGNSSDIADLVAGRHNNSGHNSATYGYTSGGYAAPLHNIEKHSFASDSNATTVGTLTVMHYGGGSNSSLTHAYHTGGSTTSEADFNTIEKWSMVSDANATDVGDITGNRGQSGGTSSGDHGYIAGGYQGGATNIIERFPFATDSNGSDVGDLGAAEHGASGQSGPNHGYCAGGDNGGARNNIYKYAYASSGGGTDIADLTTARHHCVGNQY